MVAVDAQCFVTLFLAELLCLHSVGVYLVGDAMLPEKRRNPPTTAETCLSSLEDKLISLLLASGNAASVPSYETMTRLICREASARALQELRIQEKLWDRLFSLHLRSLGVEIKEDSSEESSQCVSTSFYTSQLHFFVHVKKKM